MAQKGALQISRVLARYNTKTPLEEVETPFAMDEEPEEELTTDAIDFRYILFLRFLKISGTLLKNCGGCTLCSIVSNHSLWWVGRGEWLLTKIIFSDPEALAKALNMSSKDMK